MGKMAGRHLHSVVLSVERENLVHEVAVISWQVLRPISIPGRGQKVNAVTAGA
jgi:hypothetical protein